MEGLVSSLSPLVTAKGEKEEEEGLAKRDEQSILRRWARLFLTKSKGGSCEARRIVDPSTMGVSAP